MSNFVKFTKFHEITHFPQCLFSGREIPRHSACPRSGTRDVSESAMFLIRLLLRVKKNHGLGRTLIFNGTRF